MKFFNNVMVKASKFERISVLIRWIKYPFMLKISFVNEMLNLCRKVLDKYHVFSHSEWSATE